MEENKENKEAESGSDSEQEEEETPQEEKDNALLQACRENNVEETMLQLSKGANPLFEKDNWNPLLWAACNGNEQIVRALIHVNAHQPYLIQKSEDSSDKKEEKGMDEKHDPFVKPKDPRKVGKYTPLHWASYKGYHKVVWILLKQGISPLEIDMYGNTAVHQAAAAGNLKVLECFLSKGVDVEVKNSRGHTPMDLATEPESKKLINQATKTKYCENKACGSKFDFKNIRYYCRQSQKFFCKNCSTFSWVYEHHESKEKERPCCRSDEVQKQIEQHEAELKGAIEKKDFHLLDTGLENCKGVDIDVKLKKEAEVMHLKYDHELKIQNFLSEKDHHDNYKDIRKDVQRINDMVQKAQDLEIDLDSDLVSKVNNFTSIKFLS